MHTSNRPCNGYFPGCQDLGLQCTLKKTRCLGGEVLGATTWGPLVCTASDHSTPGQCNHGRVTVSLAILLPKTLPLTHLALREPDPNNAEASEKLQKHLAVPLSHGCIGSHTLYTNDEPKSILYIILIYCPFWEQYN